MRPFLCERTNGRCFERGQRMFQGYASSTLVRLAAWIFARIFSSRTCISSNEAEPFAVPKHSHASHSGSSEYRAKYPNPAMARCGAFSLKKNGENSGARNGCVVVGFQKLTSSHERCSLK